MPEHHQDWAAPFNEAKAQAEARRQQAIREARDAHQQAVTALREQQAAEPHEWPGDFQYARHVREEKALNDALAEAVRKADDDYQAEVARLGQEHGVTVG